MKKQFRWFFAGVLVTLLIFSLVGTAIAAYQQQKTLYYNNIKVTLDGQSLTLKDETGRSVEPFVIEGTTYLPIRAISNALNLNVSWNSATNTVVLSSKHQTTSTTPTTSTTTSQPASSALTGLFAITNPKFPLHLYSNDGRVYLGKLVTNKYDIDSIWYTYGDYGSKYSTNSIWNTYGTYGSKYSSSSAFNPYTSTPPKIVDNDGVFCGYLTANEHLTYGCTIDQLRQYLVNNNQ